MENILHFVNFQVYEMPTIYANKIVGTEKFTVSTLLFTYIRGVC